MTIFRTFTDAERAALKLHGLDTHRPSQLADAFVLGLRQAATTWQQKAAERAAFARGVSAMRDVAVTVIQARHESGYACDPWKLVEAIRAATEPTDPCGVKGRELP